MLKTDPYWQQQAFESQLEIFSQDIELEFEDQPASGIDGLVIAALALFLIMGFYLARDLLQSKSVPVSYRSESTQSNARETSPPASSPVGDPSMVVAPYDQYVVTQGLHGYSYGHAAVDLAAGRGATIRSPINGIVTEHFVDGIGNPTLVIENDRYRVTLLHGRYRVSVSDHVAAGQPIGLESNLGNTTDMQGRSCRGRDCGYHTHLNIYDKQLGQNVNPLELWQNP